MNSVFYLELSTSAQNALILPKYVCIKQLGSDSADTLFTSSAMSWAERIWKVTDGRWMVVKDCLSGDIDVDAALSDQEKTMIILSAQE